MTSRPSALIFLPQVVLSPHTAFPHSPAWVLLRGGGSARAGNSRFGWSQADRLELGVPSSFPMRTQAPLL